MLILFATIHAFLAVWNLAYGSVMRDLDPASTVLYVGRLLFAGTYVWIAGTLPLEPILPAKNVASSVDVCPIFVYICVPP